MQVKEFFRRGLEQNENVEWESNQVDSEESQPVVTMRMNQRDGSVELIVRVMVSDEQLNSDAELRVPNVLENSPYFEGSATDEWYHIVNRVADNKSNMDNAFEHVGTTGNRAMFRVLFKKEGLRNWLRRNFGMF